MLYAYKCYYKEDAFRPTYWNILWGNVNVNGDEILINNGSAERIFPTSINPLYFNIIIFRAHGEYGGDTFTYSILDSSDNVLYTTEVSLDTQYDTYIISSVGFSGTPYKHRLTSYYNVAIDFIAFTSSQNVLAEVGSVLNLKIEKKTIQKKVPFSNDVIQTLGISTPQYIITYKRVPKSVYEWFENAMAEGIGLCFILPSISTTALIRNVEAELEPGTFLYNVSVEAWKGDNEIY